MCSEIWTNGNGGSGTGSHAVPLRFALRMFIFGAQYPTCTSGAASKLILSFSLSLSLSLSLSPLVRAERAL